MRLEDRPTAVFMSNYEITLGAVMALNESGMQCPEDISMLGFDDLILSHLVKPQMHMVVQPMKEMSEKAVEILLHHVAARIKRRYSGGDYYGDADTGRKFCGAGAVNMEKGCFLMQF